MGEELRLTGSSRQQRKIHFRGELRDTVLSRGSGETRRAGSGETANTLKSSTGTKKNKTAGESKAQMYGLNIGN